MTNREYFKDPDSQQMAFLLECKLQKKRAYYWSFDNLEQKVKWLKSKVNPLIKSIPLCPICGKFPVVNDDGFLVCQTSDCKFNEITITEAAKMWKVRYTNGN